MKKFNLLFVDNELKQIEKVKKNQIKNKKVTINETLNTNFTTKDIDLISNSDKFKFKGI